jgi:type IV pilus assembly protein PilY1
MFRNRALTLLLLVFCSVAPWQIGYAQTSSSSVQEDFTSGSTTNNWYFYNGACLTASSSSSSASPGSPPGCTAIDSSYYSGEPLVGGYNGAAGSAVTLPDPTGYGALRFTNGCTKEGGAACNNGSTASGAATWTHTSGGGHHQNGAIISQNAFSTSAGLDITFKTVTYRGDSGGNGVGCPSGTTVTNGQCVGTTTMSATTTYSCPNFYTLSGSNCVQTASPTVTYTCSSGTRSGSNCIVTTSPTASYSCSSGTLSGTNCVLTTSPTITYSCASGTLSGSNCIVTTPPTASCPSGWTLSGSVCKRGGSTQQPTYSCPSGYAASGSGSSTTCSKTVAATPTYNCPSGYAKGGSGSGTTCTETIGAATASYSCPSGYTQGGSGSGTTCTKTVAATPNYTCPSGYSSSGSGSGMTCTATVTATASYSCPSGYTLSGSNCTQTGVIEQAPSQNDGADGMSFFLMDGSVDMTNSAIDHIGSWGGSLGYSCSMTNADYHGIVGGYIGLGIDEYGNFLNGTSNTLGVSNFQHNGADNTASGGGQMANRIGMRGAGSIDWYWLNATYPNYYPSTLTATQQQTAVSNTCSTGTLWDNSTSTPTNTGTTVNDYPAIQNAFTVISNTIAKEYSSGGYSRSSATPITYRLRLTEDGLLTLDFSYNGGAWTNVIKNQSIVTPTAPVPATVRFGFAGSTGGASNIHEILCFKATPVTQASSSTTVNQQQSSKVESGSQAYFGYYDPTDWTGRLTANSLLTDSSGNLTIATTANWDGSCTLTGVASGASCPTTGQAGPTTAQPWQTSSAGGRVMLTWNGTTGIPLQWSSLISADQTALTAGDSSATEYRLDYLRGDRSNEIPATGASSTQIYRDRDSILGDIVDSSSSWIGPPSKSIFSAYESPLTWRDRLYSTATMTENSGQTYDAYAQANETRLNVVYVGANDGLLHGFSAGSYDSTGSVYNSSTNTGKEVLAFMPEGVLQTIHNATNSQLDYSNPQYGHNFFVDATPGTGDLFYNGAWHTWVVGGLGAGGAEIYALDVTNPTSFTEGNASSLVIGDWTPTTISCTNPVSGASGTCTNSSGAAYLGNTYGTPLIRRLHNGDWAILFGNGIGSASGDAGLFIITISPTGAQTTYYLSTGAAGNNGIAYITPVDMDSDHIVDYVYAGDLQGNVWRFDLTNKRPSSWGVTPGPIFKTPSGQPITSAIQPDFVTGPIGSTTQLMLMFGTGEKFPLNNSTPVSYQTGTQYFYGVWDWNMAGWDAKNSSQFASLPAATVGTLTSLGSPYILTYQNLQQQTIGIDSSTGDRTIASATPVCWAGTSTCTGGSSANAKFGWYIALPGTNTAYSTTTYEQVIYNPMIVSTAVVFNSVLPAIDSPLMCTPDIDKGWTYALDVRTGGAVPNFFQNTGTSTTGNNLNTTTVGYEGDASGTSSEVDTTNGSGGTNYYLIFQSTNGGPGTPIQINPAANISSSRQTWIQLR